MLDNLFNGFNSTLIAFGQPKSGKTYSLYGDVHSSVHQGIIPRFASDLFSAIRARSHILVQPQIRVSFIELYNKKYLDLLSQNSRNVSVGHDPVKGLILRGAAVNEVESAVDFVALIENGLRNLKSHRHVSYTGSMSHTILMVSFNAYEV